MELKNHWWITLIRPALITSETEIQSKSTGEYDYFDYFW
jgi:hypothetical protein